jgi:cyclophilin family peptidyl-prolyl cis-trans isomerase/HEAT repeat protein
VRCCRWLIPFACSLALVGPTAAQDPALTDALAFLLQAEDQRHFDEALLSAAARHPERVVRRHAAMAMGRIGDPGAIPFLVELLADPDTGIAAEAAFALGLIGSAEAVAPLREVVQRAHPDGLIGGVPVDAEAAAALARIGGPDAAEAITEVLTRGVNGVRTGRFSLSAHRVVWEVWRLGARAPVELVAEYARTSVREVQIGALYSLARLRAPEAADLLLEATDHGEAEIRMIAVRALTAAYADSTGLDRGGLASRVRRLVGDDDAQVRITALRSLGTFRDSTLVEPVLDRLSDRDPNVRLQALATLADLGGSVAATRLRETAEGSRSSWAVRRQALIGYARMAGVRALDAVAQWLTTDDWTWRAAGAEALGYIPADTVVPWLLWITEDVDGRVAATAMQSLTAVAPTHAAARARMLMAHRDPVVRAVSAERMAATPDTADIALLTTAWMAAGRDSILDVRLNILSALGRIAALDFAARALVEDVFLARNPTVSSYVLRAAARERFPEAARLWGPPYPAETGYAIDDYRDIVRRILLPAESGSRLPGLVVDSDRGRFEFELFAQDAPLTVHRFLEYVDARLFDNGRFHRVVPNFVIQGGDPRGDGWGGPGQILRDENSRRRYERGMVGLALSGRDTGGSQFFVTHSRQPHLDGTYPLFGRVTSDMRVVDGITLGDRIRQVRRR